MKILLNFASFVLAQNSAEKNLTMVGLIFLGLVLLCLIIDSLAKGNFVPTKDNGLRAFLIIIFVCVLSALILFIIYYK